LFERIIHADLVTRSKPHPETYLTAAAELGVAPEQCIVFEDAPVGVRAAEAAGMRSYVILTTHLREEFSGFPSVLGFLSDYRAVSFG
jgi:beta-phosphoglucomutase-like phosphatase (HAD superfamily)